MQNMNNVKRSLIGFGALLLSAMPLTGWSHGGASVDTDQCRVQIGPHLVHFTMYQPQLTGTTEYCNVLPELGEATIVFDYEGKALRNMTVEFEITKEPEGTRIFYQEPSTHPTGTFNAKVNITEPGKYRTHISLVNEGVKGDEHIAFVAGTNQTGLSRATIFAITVLLIAGLYIFYLSNAGFRAIVDKLLMKKAA